MILTLLTALQFGRYAVTGTSPENREGGSSYEDSRSMKDDQHTQNDSEAKQARVKLKTDGSDQSEGQLRGEDEALLWHHC